LDEAGLLGGVEVSTDEKLAAMREEYFRQVAHRWDHWMTHAAESPIERLLLAQMFVDGWDFESSHRTAGESLREIEAAGIDANYWYLESDTSPCIGILQAKVLGPEGYRIDFAFVGRRTEPGGTDGPIVRLGVELDGHDFHERTKEQASRDKRRDRILTAKGWTMLRFTGSDVYRDPAAVLEEIRAACVRLCWPGWEDGK
jgi:hypothetical protein